MLLEPSFPSTKSTWFAVRHKDGRMTCSCGSSLEKVDEQTWRCSAGFTQYRFEDGTVTKDKFGNLMFKEQPHEEKEKSL